MNSNFKQWLEQQTYTVRSSLFNVTLDKRGSWTWDDILLFVNADDVMDKVTIVINVIKKTWDNES